MKTQKEIEDRLERYKKKIEERSKDFTKPMNSVDRDEYWDDISFCKRRIQILEWVLK